MLNLDTDIFACVVHGPANRLGLFCATVTECSNLGTQLGTVPSKLKAPVGAFLLLSHDRSKEEKRDPSRPFIVRFT